MTEGQGAVLREGLDAVVFGYGPIMLAQAMKAADQLDRDHGLGLKVVNLPWLNRVDRDWLRETVGGCRAVFTLDNHYVDGGQGQMVLATLSELDLGPSVTAKRFGVTRVPESGGNVEVLKAHELDGASLGAAMHGVSRRRMSADGVTTLLFWDIDGTLLTTGRAGILAWEAAASHEAGRQVDLQQLRTAGLTDFTLGRLILEQLGLTADPEQLSRLVRRYEQSLPDVLPRRQGRVLGGVGTMDLLEHIRAEHPEVGLYLLTGNTRAGARAKLTYYGLFDFFVGGAFAGPTGDRADIARQALADAGLFDFFVGGAFAGPTGGSGRHRATSRSRSTASMSSGTHRMT